MMKALLLAAALVVAARAPAQPAPAPPGLRLYALDFGRMDFEDEKIFSDTDYPREFRPG